MEGWRKGSPLTLFREGFRMVMSELTCKTVSRKIRDIAHHFKNVDMLMVYVTLKVDLDAPV